MPRVKQTKKAKAISTKTTSKAKTRSNSGIKPASKAIKKSIKTTISKKSKKQAKAEKENDDLTVGNFFTDLAKEVLKEQNLEKVFQEEALDTLKRGAKNFITLTLKDAQNIAKYDKRDQIEPRDINLAFQIGSNKKFK